VTALLADCPCLSPASKSAGDKQDALNLCSYERVLCKEAPDGLAGTEAAAAAHQPGSVKVFDAEEDSP
jgi:hypothetical protein